MKVEWFVEFNFFAHFGSKSFNKSHLNIPKQFSPWKANKVSKKLQRLNDEFLNKKSIRCFYPNPLYIIIYPPSAEWKKQQLNQYFIQFPLSFISFFVEYKTIHQNLKKKSWIKIELVFCIELKFILYLLRLNKNEISIRMKIF